MRDQSLDALAGVAENWDIVARLGRFPVCPSHTQIQQKTSFFRYRDHFNWIAKDLLCSWRKHTPRVLCLGGSTGAEAYSLAMTFHKVGLFKKYPDMKVETLDIDPVVTRIAREGIYPETQMSGVRNIEIGGKGLFHYAGWFYGENYYQVSKDLMRYVVVHDAGNHQVIDTTRAIDVLLCNNVLGHLTRGQGAELVAWLYARTPTYLMTAGRYWGYSETHARLDLQTRVDNFYTVAGSDMFKITDWPAQKPFDAQAYICLKV